MTTHALAHTGFSSFHSGQSANGQLSADALRRLKRVRRFAWLLDAAIRLPGTRVRVGADAIVGLVPGGGSTVMGLLSFYVVWEAWRMGLPLKLLLRMVGNIAIETAVDVVPVAGDLLDIAFKANMRNVAVMENWLGVPPSAATRKKK